MNSSTYHIHQGDALTVLQTMPSESVDCCITSPPYYGLRDYGVSGQIGLERTPEAYIARLVDVFREVRRVLRAEGTLWVNIGDSYAAQGGPQVAQTKWQVEGASDGQSSGRARVPSIGLKPKDLIGIPWLLAFALRNPYVDWRIKSEAMRAWVAGIVDGEGCITILRTKSSHCESCSYPPIVQVRMTDIEPLERLVSVAGSKIGNPQQPPSHLAANQRQNWQWKVVSNSAAQIIAEIYPYLTCKRKQAIVAWNHQQFRAARGNQERTRADIEREEFCKQIINDLNQRKPIDIPSWMKEPKVIEEPGYYLRQDCIWSKPNPMPESVKDRCTKAHEYIFMLSKSARYWWDADSIREPHSDVSIARAKRNRFGGKYEGADRTEHTPIKMGDGYGPNGDTSRICTPGGRNHRSVWTLATLPTPDAHFATFPIELPETCLRAGCPEGGIVLDPFSGAGTTGLACLKNGRRYVGIELNAEYIAIAYNRVRRHYPLLAGEISSTGEALATA